MFVADPIYSDLTGIAFNAFIVGLKRQLRGTMVDSQSSYLTTSCGQKSVQNQATTAIASFDRNDTFVLTNT